MNAIPQKAHNYRRAEIPRTPVKERTRPLARIESLDARRAAKMNVEKRQRQYARQMEYSRAQDRRYEDLEMYYSMKREDLSRNTRQGHGTRFVGYDDSLTLQSRKRAGVPRQVGGKKQGRKLISAYEVKAQKRSYGQSIGSGYEVGADGTLVKRAPIPGFDMNTHGGSAGAYARHVAVEYKAPRKKGVVSTIVCIALVFLMLAGVLVKYAELSKVTHDNAQAEKRIGALEQEKDKLEMEIAQSQDLGDIQTRAAALGMSHPGTGQVEYLPAGALTADAQEEQSAFIDPKTGRPLEDAAEAGNTADGQTAAAADAGEESAPEAQSADGFLGRAKEFFDNMLAG